MSTHEDSCLTVADLIDLLSTGNWKFHLIWGHSSNEYALKCVTYSDEDGLLVLTDTHDKESQIQISADGQSLIADGVTLGCKILKDKKHAAFWHMDIRVPTKFDWERSKTGLEFKARFENRTYLAFQKI